MGCSSSSIVEGSVRKIIKENYIVGKTEGILKKKFPI